MSGCRKFTRPRPTARRPAPVPSKPGPDDTPAAPSPRSNHHANHNSRPLKTGESPLFDLLVARDPFSPAFDFASIGYVCLNSNGRIAEINATAASLLGSDRHVLLNSAFMICVARADLSRFLEHLRQCRLSTSKVVTELALRLPDGRERAVQLASSRLEAPGSPLLYHTALTDLTERNRLRQAMRRNDDLLLLALRAARAGAWELDLKSGRAFWSEEFDHLFGVDSRVLSDCEALLARLHPDDRPAARRAFAGIARRSRSNFRREFRFLHPRAGYRWLSLFGHLCRDARGHPIRVVGIGIDVTDRKRAEELLRKTGRSLEARVRERTAELRTANAELNRQISQRKQLERQLLEISEREQRRIGQDLHDGLGQQLTGMRYLNNVLHEKLFQKSLPEAADAERLAQLLDHTRSQIRQLASGLHPVFPEPNGLMTALRQLAAGTAELHSISCCLDCPAPVLLCDNSTATHLFRIAQEAVNNALQHGRADEIRISLAAQDDTVCLQIQDDGKGWRARPAKNTHGLGIQIMKYRSELMGAALEFRPSPSRGLLVRCTVPLNTGRPGVIQR